MLLVEMVVCFEVEGVEYVVVVVEVSDWFNDDGCLYVVVYVFVLLGEGFGFFVEYVFGVEVYGIDWCFVVVCVGD